MGKLSLGLGLGVGYVLGAQAGRARYEQIKQAAAGFMERPEVQQALEKARTAAPAPLQGSIAKLSQGGSGGTRTVDIEPTVPAEVDVDATPSPPLPDPLIPPAKSVDAPTEGP
jgi:hypothetical protein